MRNNGRLGKGIKTRYIRPYPCRGKKLRTKKFTGESMDKDKWQEFYDETVEENGIGEDLADNDKALRKVLGYDSF